MSEYTKTPWSCRKAPDTDQEWWIDAEHGDEDIGHVRWQMMAVAYGCDDMGQYGADKAKANARHIVHCVNNHELIKGKLKTLRDSISGDCYMGKEWELETIDDLLATLEAEKGGEL